MTSASPTVNALHAAYCEARGVDLPLNCYSERQWAVADRWGITPDDVRLVVKLRMRLNRERNQSWGIHIRNLIGDDEELDTFVSQAAEARAAMRKPAFAPGKAEVLRATHRPDEPETKVRNMSEVFESMRKQAS